MWLHNDDSYFGLNYAADINWAIRDLIKVWANENNYNMFPQKS